LILSDIKNISLFNILSISYLETIKRGKGRGQRAKEKKEPLPRLSLTPALS
jgi:hypothetical protein